MKKLLAFVVMFGLNSIIGYAQGESISEDSLVNQMKLNALNLRVESGSASAEEYCERAVLLRFFGNSDEALSDYSTALKLNPNLDFALNNRGTIYQERKEYELAEKDFTAAVKLIESPSVACNNRGFLYQEMGEIDRAIKDFERAIKIEPVYAQPYMNLVDVYQNRNENEKVFEVLDRMVAAKSDDPVSYTTRSHIYRDAGMMRKALDDLNKAVEISGNDAGFLIERAKFKDDIIFDDLGAVEDCDLAIQKSPNTAEYYYQRSRPLYDLADYVAVIENCDKAIELDPKHSEAIIMKANVTDMYGFFDEAKKLYLLAISIDPDQYDGYKQLSISEFAQGNKKEALLNLETYINRGNFHKDITENHGKIAADLKQFEVSLKDFSELIERYPDNAGYYFLRGVIHDSLGNSEAACVDLVKADQLGLREAHQYLRKHYKSKLNAKTLLLEDKLDAALKLEQEGKTLEAISAYSELILIAPDSSAFYYNRGKAKRRLNNHAEAIKDYLKAIELDDDRVVYVVSLAVSYSYLDKIDEAIKEYKKAIKIEPSYAMSYYNLGGIYAQQKNYDDAIELLETSLYYSPNYTKAMMGLGDCYLEMNEMDKACEWYKKAENAGDSGAFGKRVRVCR